MAGGSDRRILVGAIAGAHGVRGDVLVQSYTEKPEDIVGYAPLTDESGMRSLELAAVRVTAKGLIARERGINDRAAAEALKGTLLYVDRSKLPATGAEEFYLADLIGRRAVSPEGAMLGEVSGVQNYGAGDLLEIRLSGGKTELIPFSTAFVPSVDVAGGRVVIVPPAVIEDKET